MAVIVSAADRPDLYRRAEEELAGPAPGSPQRRASTLRITATVADWERWVGMAFPGDGAYVFPGGLSLLNVDHRDDRGRYWEPNVWVSHPVPPGG